MRACGSRAIRLQKKPPNRKELTEGVMRTMTQAQKTWAEARRQLHRAVTETGLPGELTDLLAKQLKSPRAMERMASYLLRVKPKSMEMIVDEMLAISADQETWRKQIEAREAQAGITAWLNSEERMQAGCEEEF